MEGPKAAVSLPASEQVETSDGHISASSLVQLNKQAKAAAPPPANALPATVDNPAAGAGEAAAVVG